MKIPCYQIASNAGVDANEIVNRVLGEKAEVGYDALNGEFVDMISAGIIDPTKVCVSITRMYRLALLTPMKARLHVPSKCQFLGASAVYTKRLNDQRLRLQKR